MTSALSAVFLKKRILFWICILLLSSSCASLSLSSRQVQTGKASYYADKFNGRKTASGEKYHPGKMTAAHGNLPFGTKVKVKNLQNGKTVKVRINDRGPFSSGRIIDLSRKAAQRLDMIQRGVVSVEIRY
ncbi:septal ring lytic transglycosylase RlpA family protein [Echinicola sediminis]